MPERSAPNSSSSALSDGGQFLHLAAMLAGRGFERSEACLEPLLACRIGLEAVGVTAQARDGLATRDRGLVEQPPGLAERRVERGELADHALRATERRRHVTAFAGQQALHLCRAVGEPAERRHAAPLLGQPSRARRLAGRAPRVPPT